MSPVLLAVITDDPLGIVLAIGVIVSASSAVVYFTGRSPKRAAPARVPAKRPAEIVSASSALARAEAAALQRSTAAASADGYRLTGVRPVRQPQAPPPPHPPRVERPRTTWVDGRVGGRVDGRVDGQGAHPTDRSLSDRDVATAQARAIAFHIAETDPQRMAEVIKTWIRQDAERERGNH